jgi:hypothetical protein
MISCSTACQYYTLLETRKNCSVCSTACLRHRVPPSALWQHFAAAIDCSEPLIYASKATSNSRQRRCYNTMQYNVLLFAIRKGLNRGCTVPLESDVRIVFVTGNFRNAILWLCFACVPDRLEVNAEKTKYMVMSRDQNAGQNGKIYIGCGTL